MSKEKAHNILMDKDYIFWEGEENEPSFYTNRHTGEIIGASFICVPEGSKINTQAQQERFERKKEREYKAKMHRTARKGKSFYFAHAGECFSGLSSESVTKLIYLFSFMNYDGQLMKTQRTPIMKKDLENILYIGRAAKNKFLSEIVPNYIIVNTDGTLWVSDSALFFKGKIKDHKRYVKIFSKDIQALYQDTLTRQQRYLGYIFKLFPYINVEYNVLCHNPMEEDFNKIEPLKPSEFCELIGYSAAHFSDLRKRFIGITFTGSNKRNELFCTFKSYDFERPTTTLHLNPNIFYSGTRFNEAEIRGSFMA